MVTLQLSQLRSSGRGGVLQSTDTVRLIVGVAGDCHLCQQDPTAQLMQVTDTLNSQPRHTQKVTQIKSNRIKITVKTDFFYFYKHKLPLFQKHNQYVYTLCIHSLTLTDIVLTIRLINLSVHYSLFWLPSYQVNHSFNCVYLVARFLSYNS